MSDNTTREQIGLKCLVYLFAGVCSSTLSQASFVIMRQHFGDNFGAANTISNLGTLVGGMTVSFLTAELHEAYGLQGTLLCLGGLFLNSVPIGSLLIPTAHRYPTKEFQQIADQEGNETDYRTETCEDDDILRKLKGDNDSQSRCWKVLEKFSAVFYISALKSEPLFTFLFLPCQILFDFVYIGWVLFMVSYAISVGLTHSLAVYLPIAGAAGGFLGLIVLAIIMHYKPSWSPVLYALHVAISSVALFLYPIHSSLRHLLICSFSAGYGLFGGMSTYFAVMAIAVSEDHFPGIVAISFFISGIGTASSGFLAGKHVNNPVIL